MPHDVLTPPGGSLDGNREGMGVGPGEMANLGKPEAEPQAISATDYLNILAKQFDRPPHLLHNVEALDQLSQNLRGHAGQVGERITAGGRHASSNLDEQQFRIDLHDTLVKIANYIGTSDDRTEAQEIFSTESGAEAMTMTSELFTLLGARPEAKSDEASAEGAGLVNFRTNVGLRMQYITDSVPGLESADEARRLRVIISREGIEKGQNSAHN